jgi:hypothetical protein
MIIAIILYWHVHKGKSSEIMLGHDNVENNTY